METPKHAESKAPRFTTVGSVYNPQATPLQPPARRGRTIKWPPHAELGMHRSVTGIPYRSQHYSPPTMANNLQQYSPLQQNSDRAVSPVNQNIASTRHPPLPSPTTTCSGKHGGTNQANESDDEDFEANETLRGMSVKSLTNLASYPNPMQKNAQKLLSRARPLAISTNMPASLRAVRSDPVSLADLVQSDGASEHSRSSGRDLNIASVLPKGPGAPLPLTAGPPGVRQLKSSILDHGRGYAAPDGVKSPESCGDQVSANSTSRYHPAYERTSDHIGGNHATLHSMLGLQRASSKMTDTLAADKVRQYYPQGLPSDFNANTKPIASDWTDVYPLNEFGRSARPELTNMESRQAEIDAHWYSGGEMLHKTMDQAISEKQHRDFAKFVGVIGQERKQAKGKSVTRKITIEEANATPTSDHAKPLLSMAYQTFINHPQLNEDPRLPQFKY